MNKRTEAASANRPSFAMKTLGSDRLLVAVAFVFWILFTTVQQTKSQDLDEQPIDHLDPNDSASDDTQLPYYLPSPRNYEDQRQPTYHPSHVYEYPLFRYRRSLFDAIANMTKSQPNTDQIAQPLSRGHKSNLTNPTHTQRDKTNTEAKGATSKNGTAVTTSMEAGPESIKNPMSTDRLQTAVTEITELIKKKAEPQTLRRTNLIKKLLTSVDNIDIDEMRVLTKGRMGADIKIGSLNVIEDLARKERLRQLSRMVEMHYTKKNATEKIEGKTVNIPGRAIEQLTKTIVVTETREISANDTAEINVVGSEQMNTADRDRCHEGAASDGNKTFRQPSHATSNHKRVPDIHPPTGTHSESHPHITANVPGAYSDSESHPGTGHQGEPSAHSAERNVKKHTVQQEQPTNPQEQLAAPHEQNPVVQEKPVAPHKISTPRHKQRAIPHEKSAVSPGSPTVPVEHPATPPKHAAAPHKQSTAPDGHPAGPHEHPAAPHKQSTAPDGHPAGPHEHPAAPHKQSTAPDGHPAGPHEHPAASPEQPTAPHKPSAAPHKSPAATHKPSAAPHEPPATKSEPSAAPHKPPATTHEPSAAPHKPPATTHELSAVPHKPPAATHKPSAASHNPPATTHEPSAAPDKPPATTHEFSAVPHKPPAATHKPSAALHQPPATTHEPSEAPHKPPGTTHDPSAAPQDSPTALHEHPATPHHHPAAPQGHPTASREKSAGPHENPMASNEKPSAAHAEPAPPHGKHASPHGLPALPHEEHEKLAASHNKSVTPHGKSSAAHVEDAEPHKRPKAPQEIPAAPRKKPTEHHEEPAAVHEKPATPHDKPVVHHKQSVASHKESATKSQITAHPNVQAPSVHRTAEKQLPAPHTPPPPPVSQTVVHSHKVTEHVPKPTVHSAKGNQVAPQPQVSVHVKEPQHIQTTGSTTKQTPPATPAHSEAAILQVPVSEQPRDAVAQTAKGGKIETKAPQLATKAHEVLHTNDEPEPAPPGQVELRVLYPSPLLISSEDEFMLTPSLGIQVQVDGGPNGTVDSLPQHHRKKTEPGEKVGSAEQPEDESKKPTSTEDESSDDFESLPTTNEVEKQPAPRVQHQPEPKPVPVQDPARHYAQSQTEARMVEEIIKRLLKIPKFRDGSPQPYQRRHPHRHHHRRHRHRLPYRPPLHLEYDTRNS